MRPDGGGMRVTRSSEEGERAVRTYIFDWRSKRSRSACDVAVDGGFEIEGGGASSRTNSPYMSRVCDAGGNGAEQDRL